MGGFYVCHSVYDLAEWLSKRSMNYDNRTPARSRQGKKLILRYARYLDNDGVDGIYIEDNAEHQ